MKYTVQRPTIEWIEVVIDNANNLEHAIELADEVFKHGEYEYVDNTWSIDWWRFRVEDETGKVFFDNEETENKL